MKRLVDMMPSFARPAITLADVVVTCARRLKGDRRGIAGVEFALVFPMMVILYFGAVETSQVLSLHRKVSAVASAVTDLVTQEKTMDAQKIADFFEAANWMSIPFAPEPMSVVVTSVVADPATGAVTVAWSEAMNGSPRAPGSSITLPDGIISAGASVVMTEVSYQYDSVIGHFVSDGFTVSDTFYAKPRKSKQIPFT